MTRRFVPVCALVAALSLSACGSSGSDELTPASSEQQVASSLAADLAPLHAEAVEVADAVLAASPPAAVATVVEGIRAEQTALRDDVAAQLDAAGRTPAETGALAATELEALRSAAGDEAVRLGLDALLRNHLAAVGRAKAAVVDGARDGDRALADRVLSTQGAALQALAGLG